METSCLSENSMNNLFWTWFAHF